MSPQTRLLGQVFGIGCALLCGIFAARPRTALSLASSLEAGGALWTVTGVFTLLTGVMLVAAHPSWGDGTVGAAVTGLSWATAIKGAAILTLPPPALGRAYGRISTPGRMRLVLLVAFALFVWLSAAALAPA
jgi:hypothetical protein